MTIVRDRPKVTPEMARNSAHFELCKRSTNYFAKFAHISNDDPFHPMDTPFVLWDYQQERVNSWDDRQSEIILKARQLGFSWTVALYVLRRAMLNGWKVGYWSKGDDEAIYELNSRILYIYDRLPKWLQVPYRRRDTLVEFTGGGSIKVFPGTKSGGVGYTLQLAVADEAALHPYGLENYQLYIPTLSAGGQYLALSTSDPELGPSGFFYDLWQKSVEGQSGYNTTFVPWAARPDRDEAWRTRERARLATLSEEAFNAAYPSTPEQAFVGKAGLVYPQFSRERHVLAEDPVKWEECISRWAGYDLGGGDPSAIVALGLYRAADGSRRVHQFGEFYKTKGSPTVDELSDWLAPWHQRAPFDMIEPDPVGAAGTVKQSLALVYPVAPKPVSRDKGERLTTQGFYLDNDLLTINAACVNSIKEFSGYRWVENIDSSDRTRYKTGRARDNHADAMDARGQTLIRIFITEMSSASRATATIRWA